MEDPRQTTGGRVVRFRARGFTLLEMLLVMTLAALIVTVVPASFNAVLPHVEREAELRGLVSTLRSVRGMAIRERREVSLMLDLKRRQYQQVGSEQVIQLPEVVVLSFRPAFASSVEQSPVVIRFFADGSSSGGTIELAAADARYEIQIDWLSGRVSYREQV